MRILRYLLPLLAAVGLHGAAYDTRFEVINSAGTAFEYPVTADPNADSVWAWDDSANAPMTVSLTAYSQTLIAAANEAAWKGLLNLEIGTDVQAYHDYLADIAAVSAVQGNVLYFDGTDWVVLAPGTDGQVLKTQGAGANPVWVTLGGGGDALVANPLSQFAATTSAQLAGVISDETGTGILVFGTAPTFTTSITIGAATLSEAELEVLDGATLTTTEINYVDGVTSAIQTQLDTKGVGDAVKATNETITGAWTFSGVATMASPVINNPSSAMAALAVDVTKDRNTKTISADSTLTFSATASTGGDFGLILTNSDTSAHAITIPSSYSYAGGGTITSFNIPASSTVRVVWEYDGSTYYIRNEPYAISDLTEETTPASGEWFMMELADGTNAKVDVDNMPGGGIADPGSNGVVVRTATDTTTARTLTGGNRTVDGSTELVITNGDGVSGNPTFTTTEYSANPALGANSAAWATNGLWFEGATSDTIETLLQAADPTTADKTVTIPAATGTIVLKDTTDTLTNKTIDGDDNTVQDIGIVKTEFIPIGWTEDGAVPPAATAVIDVGTRAIAVRDFAGATADEDVEGTWMIPADAIDGSATTDWQMKVRVLAVVTSATAPATGEGVAFQFAAASVGDDDPIDATLGTAVTIEDVDIDTQIQFDLVVLPWVEFTMTGAAAGELMVFKLHRDQAAVNDDYAQDIGVYGLEIKYKAQNDSATY